MGVVGTGTLETTREELNDSLARLADEFGDSDEDQSVIAGRPC